MRGKATPCWKRGFAGSAGGATRGISERKCWMVGEGIVDLARVAVFGSDGK